MIDFLNSYGDTIIGSTAIIAALAPLVRKRIIGDGKLLANFDSFKAVTQKVMAKEVDIVASIGKINTSISQIEEDVKQEIKNMNESILAFQESELYSKMLSGLAQVDQLQQRLENDNLTIEFLGAELKETKLLLEKIYNQVKE